MLITQNLVYNRSLLPQSLFARIPGLSNFVFYQNSRRLNHSRQHLRRLTTRGKIKDRSSSRSCFLSAVHRRRGQRTLSIEIARPIYSTINGRQLQEINWQRVEGGETFENKLPTIISRHSRVINGFKEVCSGFWRRWRDHSEI